MRIASAAAAATVALVGCGGSTLRPLPALDSAHDVVAPVSDGAGVDWLGGRPLSMEVVSLRSQLAVIATVVRVERAKALVAAPDEVNARRLVTLRVRDAWFGDAPAFVTVNWLSRSAGDPPYAVGQDYVLFLIPRSDGPWYRPDSPDGRIQIVRGRPHPVIEGLAGDEAKRLGLAGIKRLALRVGGSSASITNF